MKKLVKIYSFIIISLLTVTFLGATTFVIELGLFEGFTPFQSRESISNALLSLTISDSKSGLKISHQTDQLKQIFNLQTVRFIEKGRILWHPKDESGKTIWDNFKREKIIYPRIKVTVTIGGNEYLIFLMPYDVALKDKIKLKIEVYKSKEAKNKENIYGLMFGEERDSKSNKKNDLLQKTEMGISWHTPMFLKLDCGGKIYFLSIYNSYILGSPVPGVIKKRELYTVEEDEEGYQVVKRYKVTWKY